MKKAWHIVKEPHFQYYLVDVIAPKQNTEKVLISYCQQRYLVNQQQLVPYSTHQPKNIKEIEHCNEVQILQYLNRQFDVPNYWIRVNSKLVIDFYNNTETQREKLVRFIFKRLLITDKRKQYLCISNHQSVYNKNGVVINTLFQVIKGINNLWRYRISLDDLARVYAIFFRDIPIKLKVFIKNGEVIKLLMVPYNLFSLNLLGTPGANGVINLKARIFNVMASSNRQIKNYYRVPYNSSPSQAQAEDLQTLTNYLMHIGLTVHQIKSILQIYSLIMTINCLQVVKCRKQQKNPYKIREGSIGKTNLNYLIGDSLTYLLEQELFSCSQREHSKEDTQIKQQLLMLVIYQEITLKLAQILRQKMSNTSQTLQNYQEFILIQFPPVSKEEQKTAQQYFMQIVNDKIQSIGLNIPFKRQTYDFKFTKVNELIKENYRYDINKQILKMMEKSHDLIKKLRVCKFMVNLRMSKLNWINNEEIKYRQGKIEDLFEELSNIQTNQYFENYIIQTSLTSNQLPFSLDLINNIQQSVQLSKNNPTEQSQPLNEELIQVSFKKFKDNYGFCPTVKQFFKPSNASPRASLDQYLRQHKDCGAMKENEEKVCISLPFYQQLQQQKQNVQAKLNKIKNMMKTIKFRVSILSNLHRNSRKSKLIFWLCKKINPILSCTFKQVRERAGCNKLQSIVNKKVYEVQKYSLKRMHKISAIALMKKVLETKQTQREKKMIAMNKLKNILKRHRCKQFTRRVQDFMNTKTNNYKKQIFDKLNKQYNIIVNPPPAPSNPANKTPKEENNSLNITPSQNPPPPKPAEKEPVQPKTKSNTMNVPPPEQLPKIPEENQNASKMQQLSNSQQNQLVDQDEQSYQNANSQSNYSSTNRGIQKSQTLRAITQPQLFSLRDCPKFTFEIWCQQAVGFQSRKPAQPQQSQTSKLLFNKPQGEKPIHKQQAQQLNVDILIKQKIVINPFFPYLMIHIQAKTQEEIQQIMSHQDRVIKSPLLKQYPKLKHPNTAMETFNNLLKIGLDKNTSKSNSELINMIVKPIRDTYHSEKSNISTIFDGQPAIIADYTWDHNLIKDEIFMQFIKQVMMNHNQQSVQALASTLQVITRYYYPSPKFIYCFLHFLKSLQSKNIQKLNDCFLNTLLFAQAFERYKGNNVTVLNNQVLPKQKQSYPQLQPRFTLITQLQLNQCLKIQLRIINEQIFEFTVRNETLSHFKRKVLKAINMLHYQQYFGVYYSYENKSNHCLMKQEKKAIDFLIEYPQTLTEHLLYVKLKYYFPFNIKQVNKTRLMYLNSIIQERVLPWAGKEYQKCVVLSMMFEEFEEYRIGNYMIITNQVKSNIQLKSIQQRYTEMANQKGKKICEIQYFKVLKQNGFLAAKAYRVKEQHPESSLYKITTIIIKPLQLCFYYGIDQKSSVDLHRIKGYAMQKGEIYLQLDFMDEGHVGMRTLSIKSIDRIHEFYMDLTTYIGYINDC